MSDTPVTTYVYVIGRDEGPVKVGITTNLIARLRSMQTGCPFKLQLLYAMPAENRDNALWHERIFHDVYAEHRLEGEWFNLAAYEAIEGVQTGFQHEQWNLHKAILLRPRQESVQ
jgi:hypothetical protein